ncbi:MAG: hypothetical protein VX527_04655 [Planctomycetota bacterium]|nr:hypothetical protein [Planctomycetota bacterium]
MKRLIQIQLFVVLILSGIAFGQAVSNERQAWYLPPCPELDVEYGMHGVKRSLADDSFKVPADGISVLCSNGQQSHWRYIDMGASRHSFDAEPGSWLYFSIDDLPAGAAVVDVQGHQTFYVNGQARSGRPRWAGMLKYPVDLQEGTNEFLVHVEKGPVVFKVQPLGSGDEKVRFLQYDRVLPWLDDLQNVDVVASFLLVNAGEAMTDLRIATKTRFEPLNDWVDYPDDAVPGVWEYEPVPSIPAWSMMKIPFRVVGPPPHKRTGLPYAVDVELQRATDGEVVASMVFNMSARNIGNHELRTWVDELGTVQSCMVLPPAAETRGDPPVIIAMPSVLRSMHESAYAYEEGPGELIIAPNTRRIGLGGTSMGRANVDSALAHVRTLHAADDQNIAINGFADAGQDAWNMAQRRPGLFSGVVPVGTDVEIMEDTPLWSNLHDVDVIFRHGKEDDTVDPELVARMERARKDCQGRTLIDIQPEFERWWGATTISDVSLSEFLFDGTQERPDTSIIELVQDHATQPNPDHWAVIHQRVDMARPGQLKAEFDSGRVMIQTDNVRQLLLRGELLEATGPLEIDIDGMSLSLDSDAGEICLQRESEGWQFAQGCDPSGKTRLRSCYEHVFNRPLLMVHGTGGGEALAHATWAKARFDAEQSWNLADGSVRIVSDRELAPEMLDGVNVILYGNADTNSAWADLMPDCPIKVHTGSVHIGDQAWEGDDLVAMFIQPMPGDRHGLVVAVGSTGAPACRVAQHLPTTDPAATIPDWMLMNRATLGQAPLMAGEFDRDWAIPPMAR